MISKRTIVDKREIVQGGIIQVRFRKEIVEDGKVLAFEYHRTSLEPGTSLANQMAAVNDHLEKMGHAPVDDDGVASIRRIMDVEHTPEAVEKFRLSRIAPIMAESAPEVIG